MAKTTTFIPNRHAATAMLVVASWGSGPVLARRCSR